MTPSVIPQEVARQEPNGYFQQPGLSCSGLRDLAVSPLRYWHLHVSPDRPVTEPTSEMLVGSAVHCAILEPAAFDQRYACELIPPDGALDTIQDIRQWIVSKGGTPKGTRKDDVIASAYAVPGEPPVILETLRLYHAEQHAGKVIFKDADWQRIHGAKQALLQEPRVAQILESSGKPEAEIFVKDAETGILLKGKLDWLATTLTMDLKTFSQKRGKSIDKSIADAILYEAYYRQAFYYGMLRGWPKEFSGEFVMAFVEADAPFEVRLRVLRPKTGGNANLYWERARVEVRQLIRLYAECIAQFGDRPWRYAQEITPLADEELPGLSYAA